MKYCLSLIVGVVLLFVLNLLVGSVSIPVSDVFSILAGGDGVKETWRYIVMENRLPQALTALLCGAALAVSGLLLQTAFRNPLAGPSVFGINSGAGLGVALVLLWMGGSVSAGMYSVGGFMAILLSAFVGAMAVTSLILLFSTLVSSRVLLLIIGIMVGYLANSAITLLNFFATEEGVRSYMVWGMGNFGGVSMSHMPLFATVVAAGLLASVLLVKPLNAMLLGEQYAENLGVDIRRTRFLLLVVTGILTAITTAFCGPVAFIGLSVPHIARLLTGTENHRLLLPATILCGAVVALLCNLLCCLPGESGIIPLNAVTPLIGAPVIVYVLLRRR
jgi:iron complex transport system permease protein